MAKDDEPVTIVGGRPLHRAVDAALLPRGVEQVLTLGALDHDFRQQLGADPIAAARAKGIALDEAERTLLGATSPSRLVRMAERLIIPRTPGRRQFVKAVSASVIAMVAGHAVMLCSGCTGADTWRDGGTPTEQWMQLGGHTCYVYLPGTVVAYPSEPAPVLLALHDQGETCLANVVRWRNAADQYGFSLLSVNWTEEAVSESAKQQLVADLPAILTDFDGLYRIDPKRRHLCSRGASSPLAWQAGYLQGGVDLATAVSFKSCAFLGGVPEGDWQKDAKSLLDKAPSPRVPLYYVLGKQDPEYPQGAAFASALGQTAALHEVDGSTASLSLDFAALWYWLDTHAA